MISFSPKTGTFWANSAKKSGRFKKCENGSGADAEDPQPEFQTKKKTGPSRRQSEGQVSPGVGGGPKPKKKRTKKRPTRKSMPELAPEDDDSGGFE